VLDSVLHTNDVQPLHLVDIIKDAVGSLKGKTVTVLGLSFKPNTDDVRATRALPIIKKLIDEGAHVRAYDPQATSNFRKLTSLPVEYYEGWEDALKGADLAVVQSDWKEIKDIRPEDFKRLLKSPIVVDGRRTYSPAALQLKGVRYYAIGWKNNPGRVPKK
jgi:UDPglucose 6-dehydrogenase